MTQQYRSSIQVFSDEQIASLRLGGRILSECLEHVGTLVRPGITTGELDTVAESFIRDRGGLPAFKGYRGFPGTLCTSVNDACVHGIPGSLVLREGDIVGLDCGVLFDDLYTDACTSFGVGRVSAEAQKLLMATEESLQAGIAAVRAGIHTGDISSAVHATLRRYGFDAIRALTGHGLGSSLHQYPDIPNFGEAGRGPVLPLHTIIAIEPISTAGKATDVREDDDHWTLRTTDGALSGHFEHTILVTEEGSEILA